MKRIVIIIAAIVLTATSLSAQVAPGMKYRELKHMYNPREYVKSDIDPYSKGWSGLASFFVPGLGQLICGETGRGLAVFAGDAALGLATSLCAAKYKSYLMKDPYGNYVEDVEGGYVVTDDKAALKWSTATLVLAAGNVAYWIWNICDARNVARVKNMYYQDLQMRPVEFSMYPSVSYTHTPDGLKPVTGMTLSLQF